MQETIDITAMEPRVFGVQITEGTTKTNHRVAVSDGILDLLGTDPDDSGLQERLVRESIKFLLDREPATEILDHFALDDITRYFPSYRDEISSRMSA